MRREARECAVDVEERRADVGGGRIWCSGHGCHCSARGGVGPFGPGKTAPHIDFIDPRTRTNPIYQISPYIDTATEAELVSLCHAVRGVRWHPDFVDLIPASTGSASSTIGVCEGARPVQMKVFTPRARRA